MAIKKYTNGAWVPITYHKYGTETESITSLPAQIIGDGQSITSCQISGNTVQNGTPSPDSPVDVVGCGVRTGNLFDKSVYLTGGTKRPDLSTNYRLVITGLKSNTQYTLSSNVPAAPGYNSLYIYDSPWTTYDACYVNHPLTYTTDSSGNLYFEYARRSYYNNIMDGTYYVLLNEGPVALPYEPYGYKLPITVNGTEYPIYLGQVETTRRVKKLVLTGEDSWSVWYGNYYSSVIDRKSRIATILCTHFINSREVGISYDGYSTNGLRIAAAAVPFASSLNDLTAWLAAQYAASTPVTVWYVLATPETGIVNEPLMKIGDYADTVTAANVPTTGTPENFDVQTTLKPSEVQLTYHGWHEHTDTKYTQGE